MSPRRACLALLILTLALAPRAAAQEPADARLIQVDREKREVRVRCQALRVDMPLEFFCVVRGTADHESVLRTVARPSAVHAALLGMGLEPGHPLRFDAERKDWIPPAGPPVKIEVEWEENGRTVRRPAGELMKNIKTGEAMPAHPWVFSGSEIGPDGNYGADVTGQFVSLVNFEYTTLDVPRIASNANETLEWVINEETMPPDGADVWLILTPVENGTTRPATGPASRPSAAAGGDVEGEGAPAPVDVVVVMLDGAGEVMVNNRPVALAEAGGTARAHLPEGGRIGRLPVRLSAVRGAPLDVLGRLLAELVESEITNVTFAPPPDARGPGAPEQAAQGEEVEVTVHENGREVTFAGRRQSLGQFVEALRQGAEQRDRPARSVFVIRPDPEGQGYHPVDFAAVHAALYVLGYDARVEADGYQHPATQPAP